MFGSGSGIDQNLILTGYIGPGQLSIARQTAERLRMPLVDFDQRLEHLADMEATEVRAAFGEARLRTLESSVIEELLLYRGSVMHISGAVLAQNDYYDRLAPTGFVLTLVSSLDAALSRVYLALGSRYHDPRERDIAVGVLRREWVIRARPGLTELDASALTDAALIEAIIALWRERAAVIDWR